MMKIHMQNAEFHGSSSSQTPILSMSSITMETGEQGTRRVGNPAVEEKEEEEDKKKKKKSKSNRSDLAGPDR